MGEQEPNSLELPENDNGDRERELAWLEENRALFYAISTVASEIMGPGILVVDTANQLPNGGHSITYRSEGELELNEALEGLLQEYNPHREFIVTLLKADGQSRTYVETAPETGWWESMTTQTAVWEQEPNKATEIPNALFDLGQIVVTRGAAETAQRIGRHPIQLIARHVEGDWGSLPPEDIEENQFSLKHGYRIFSAYNIEDAKFYVITEWDRSVTTALLPQEY